MNILAKSLCVPFGALVLVAGAAAQTPVSPPGSWPFAITTSGSFRLTANMIAPTGTSAITINANHVTLDLNGFTVGQAGLGPSCAPDTATGYGNTCTAAAGAFLIVANGRNIKISNGTVTGGSSGGIAVTGPGTTDATYAVLEDLAVIGTRATGILVSGYENRFSNVVSSLNAGVGIDTGGLSIFENVTTNWNNSRGLNSIQSNILRNAVSKSNGWDGILFAGVIDGAVTQDNNGSGIVTGGVTRNVYSWLSATVPDYFSGILIDSNFNGPVSSSISVTGCYAQVEAQTISGGTPMTSNICP